MKRLGIALLLAALVFGLYRKVTRLWWTYDDAYQLHLVVDHPLADSFFAASMWPQKLFTPLMSAAYEAQLAAFGLEPSRWYAAHLVLLALTAIALYATLRRWLSIAASLTGAILFVAALPLCALIAVVGGTHYFQAILLACLSTILFMRGRLNASAFVYLLAMLAKETVVPLAVLFVFLPERKRVPVAHAIALAIYLLWRRAVIGTILGGYGWAIDAGEWPRLVALLPKKIVLACAGANLVAGIALLVITAIGVVLALRTRRAVLLFVVALALAVGPILPVSKEMQPRYALMPWLVWSIAFVAGADRLKRGRVPLLAAAALVAIVANRQEWSRELRKTERMSTEGRFFFDLAPDGVLRNPIVPPAAMGETAWLKLHAGRPMGAGFFYDDYFLCTGHAIGKRILEYQPARHGVVEIDPRAVDCTTRSAPLHWRFRYGDGVLHWRFGPYEHGRYRVLIGDGLQAFDVPREDAFRLPDVPGLAVRIRYDSPEGWKTYSPEIRLDFRSGR